MHFDPSPEEMQSAGQIWFPGHYDRIRWWVKEGESTLIRPSLSADAAEKMGLDGDVFWAEVGRLTREDGNRVFAEWIVGRPDLGLSVVSSKIEPAVDSYYRGLMRRTFPPSDRSVRDCLGSLADAVLEEFSSRSPGFVMLSTVDRAPVVDATSRELLEMLTRSENVCPMKKAVYSRNAE